MKTIRFTRNTDPEREGGPGYKAGDTATLRGDRAQRWIRRGAAVDVPEPVRAKKGTPAEAPAATAGLTTHPGQDVAGGVMAGAAERAAERRAEEAASKAAPTRDELVALAEATGVKTDGRWSDERLKEEIEKAAEASAASKAKK
jgi:hypothetical protein